MPRPGDIVANKPETDMLSQNNKEKAHKKSTSKLTSDGGWGGAMKSSKCVGRRLRGSMSGGDQ